MLNAIALDHQGQAALPWGEGIKMSESDKAERLATHVSYALALRDVSQKFGALSALSGIDLAVRVAERHAILGTNGAGKTTLFNVITGDFPPTSGSIQFFGEDITNFPAHERIRRGLRRTYQISQLFAGLTVLDAIWLACLGVSHQRASFLRKNAKQDATRVQAEHIAHLVHLDDMAGKIIGSLAHGAQRQLEIALALAGSPRLILFDEPAAGLSPAERNDLVAILRSLPEHIGFIIIEHDLEVALRVVSRVTMMNNGAIFKRGTPDEIANDEEVQSHYLGKKFAAA